MRRLLGIILIVMGVLVAVATLGGTFLYQFMTGQEMIDSTSLSIDGINQIEVDTRSSNVTLLATDSDQIHVELKTEDKRTKFNTYSHGDKLTIEVNQPRFQFLGHVITWFMGEFHQEVQIAIPRSYHGELVVDGSSGHITVNDLQGLSRLLVDNSSGHVNIDNVEVDSFQFDGSSGHFTARQLTTKQTEIDISSGKVVLEKVTGQIRGNSSSGSIIIDVDRLDAPIRWAGSSGTITLRLPEDASFELDASTSSGSIHSDFPIQVNSQSNRQLRGTVGDGKVPIELRVSSGSIKIERSN